MKYMKYIDDCFAKTSCEEKNKLLFQQLKEAYEAIMFINECETNNQLFFLNFLLVNRGGKFKSKVYRKPNFTNKYFNFKSFCSKLRKIGLIKTLYSRAKKMCSSEFL